MQDALRAVHERGHVAGHLVADDAGGERCGLGASHLGDAPVLDGDAEATGVGTIEGADAGAFDDRHWVSSLPGYLDGDCFVATLLAMTGIE